MNIKSLALSVGAVLLGVWAYNAYNPSKFGL
jgi:hypothetical protein